MPLPSSDQTIGKPFTELSTVDSTNNYAMAQARQGFATHGATWFAHVQTAGKGQRGKRWEAAPCENILLSVLLDARPMLVSSQFMLSAAVALSVYDLLQNTDVSGCFIKWPNDIYWNDRKAGGILIENIFRGTEWQWAVAGIGLNVNQLLFEASLPNPVSLQQITGNTYKPVALAKAVCSLLQQRFALLANNQHELLLNDYNAVLYKRNKKVLLKKDNAIFECTVQQVNMQGKLEVTGAPEPQYAFGEVEWIIN